MLTLPEGPPIYRIMSLDPGTDTLGVAIIDLDLRDYSATIVFANTIKGNKRARLYPEMEEDFGSRAARLHSLSVVLRELVFKMRPNCVISESPYMGKFAQAFEALVQCLGMIQGVIYEYDPTMVLETIDPPSAKKATGASGRGGDKMAVSNAIRNLVKLRNATGFPIEALDEHTTDAIAVGCYKLRTIDDSILT